MFLFFFISLFLSVIEEKDRQEISLLAHQKKIHEAFKLYNGLGKHEPQLLALLSRLLIQQGIEDSNQEISLLALSSAYFGSVPIEKEWLVQCLLSPSCPNLVLELALRQDPELVSFGLQSASIGIRLNSLLFLLSQGHSSAIGQIDALRRSLPPEAGYLFPSFYAMEGSSSSILQLEAFLHDSSPRVRFETLQAIRNFGVEELKESLHSFATLSQPQEQEIALGTLGLFQDARGLPMLRRALESPHLEVQLAARMSLQQLGFGSQEKHLCLLATSQNPFAPFLIEKAEHLYPLLSSKEKLTRCRAAVALLYLMDPKALPHLEEILLDEEHLFIPLLSKGTLFHSFDIRPILSSTQEAEEELSLIFKEKLIESCAVFGPPSLLSLAKRLIHQSKSEFYPTLFSQLAAFGCKEVLDFLYQSSHSSSPPALRYWAQFSLAKEYNLENETAFFSFIEAALIEEPLFSPLSKKIEKKSSPFSITKNHLCLLVLETLHWMIEKQEEKKLSLILKWIDIAHPKNRFLLAASLYKMVASR